eukprot:CCRYP_020502-RA/>CCRYP_020502-RA protein AED:0.43 eAED:-0.03 QI:0/-1/0/1/-1/1/1/0/273
MRACGLTPWRQVLDNEASTAYKQSILYLGLTSQLVPPNDHRLNVTEKAIQTWKTTSSPNLVAATTNFPYTCGANSSLTWNGNSTYYINLMLTPKSPHMCSSTAHTHNYKALPFVPLGVEALVHDKPTRSKTYAQHCSKGWVLGTSTQHYRCWKIWSTATHTTRIAATVFFKHKYLTNPSISPADALIAATANLAHAIQHNAKAQHIGVKNAGPAVSATTFPQNSDATARHSCTTPTSHRPGPTSKGADTYAIQSPLSRMMMTVMMNMSHLQGC